MPKLLIAVKSCIRDLDAGFHDCIRRTWLQDAKQLGIDVRFFVGQGLTERRVIRYQPDETALACPDDYDSLPVKTQQICLWANGKTYPHIFLCDTDTFLIPRLMLASGYDRADYAGRFNGNTMTPITGYRTVSRSGHSTTYPTCYPWASGGYGYFLSRRAFNEVAYSVPKTWAEDFHVGQTLGPLAKAGDINILDTTEQQYSNHFPSHVFKSGYSLDFKWMESNYEASKQ
jgi:hypothetical protein